LVKKNAPIFTRREKERAPKKDRGENTTISRPEPRTDLSMKEERGRQKGRRRRIPEKGNSCKGEEEKLLKKGKEKKKSDRHDSRPAPKEDSCLVYERGKGGF